MTDALMITPAEGVYAAPSSEVLSIQVDTSLYGEEALFRACYQFTDRCYLFLRRSGDTIVTVEMRRRDSATDLGQLAGSFANELIDQRLRVTIARDTARVRDLIVRQAFAEADFDGPTL